MSSDRPIHILVNATSARVGGGLSLLTRQLRAYGEHHPEDRLTVLGAPWNQTRLVETTGLAVQLVPVSSTPERIRFEQLDLAARARDFDLLYNPANLAPVRPLAVPSVLMLQNLAYFGEGPNFASHQAPIERVKRRLVRASIRSCDGLICVSQALGDAVVRDSPRAAAKMQVIRPGPFGPEPLIAPDAIPGTGTGAGASAGDATSAEVEAVAGEQRDHRADYLTAKRVLQTHFEGRGYVLSVANYYDYKRLDDVVRAWARADGLGFDHDLLLVGTVPTEMLMELRELAPIDRRHRIHFHGQLRAPEDLVAAYRGAAAVVCLSALESLSLVPVEAAALGVPTVLSSIPAHRELPETSGQFRVPVSDITAASDALVGAVSGPRPEPVNLLSDWATHSQQLHQLFHQLATKKSRWRHNS